MLLCTSRGLFNSSFKVFKCIYSNIPKYFSPESFSLGDKLVLRNSNKLPKDGRKILIPHYSPFLHFAAIILHFYSTTNDGNSMFWVKPIEEINGRKELVNLTVDKNSRYLAEGINIVHSKHVVSLSARAYCGDLSMVTDRHVQCTNQAGTKTCYRLHIFSSDIPTFIVGSM